MVINFAVKLITLYPLYRKGGMNTKIGWCCELVINESCQQPLICEKVFLGIEEKFKVGNHRIEDLENQTEKIYDINKILSELQILVGLQRQDGIKRDEMINEFNINQIKITNTLESLANKLNNTDLNVDKLSRKIDEISNDNKMKLSDIIKNLLIIAMSMGFGAVISMVLK